MLLVITALALMSLDERGSGVINSARTVAQDVVSPLQSLADDVINPASDWLDGLGRANELQDENTRLREQLAAAKSEIAAAKGSLAELNALKEIVDLPDIADADGVVAEVVAQTSGQLLAARSRSPRAATPGSPGECRWWWAAPTLRRWSGRCSRCRRPSAIVRRIDDANFGAGAQLVQDKGVYGPKGAAAGQRGSRLLRFSVIGDSGTFVTMKKGDVAVTLGLPTESFPQGLVIGTVVHEVGAGGAVARDAELRPVVDLDALNFVKVLKYTPAVP